MGWNDHFLLQAKDKGYNRRLVGKVALVYIFVTDPISHWKNQRQVDDCIRKIKQVSGMLMREAKKQHVNLQIKDFVMKSFTDEVVSLKTSMGWQTPIVQHIYRNSLKELQYEIKRSQEFTEVAVIFLFNRAGRSFAFQERGSLYGDEFAAVYEGKSVDVIAHEVLHLFGAVDFYYMNAVEKAAQRYLQGGVMLGNTKEMILDDLTLYLIGWHQKISRRAEAFLKSVSMVSQSDWTSALKTIIKKEASG